MLRNSIERIRAHETIAKAKETGSGNDNIAHEDEEAWDIFDDTDFYHQLLRDVVDSRKDGNGAFSSWISRESNLTYGNCLARCLRFITAPTAENQEKGGH